MPRPRSFSLAPSMTSRSIGGCWRAGLPSTSYGPADTLRLITVVLNLFPSDAATRLGKVLAFIGTKGGPGSSTVAQNTAWALAKDETKVLMADLDLQFGTAALSYNIDAPVGIHGTAFRGRTP